MCSILKYKDCIGRNFDYEISYDEELRMVDREEFDNKYKIKGMVTGMVKDYPLFYDAMNEYGLVCGGLAFSKNAIYNPPKQHMHNIPSYDFVLRIVGDYKSVDEVKQELKNINITYEAYSKEMQPSDLHWFVSDTEKSIIIEQTNDGLRWYDGDVMTNNPPYPHQYSNFMQHKSVMKAIRTPEIDMGKYYSRGMESRGLTGDYTSEGRFVRLSYLKDKLEESENSFNQIVQTFHLLSSIEQIYGVTHVGDEFEYTIYSVVYDMDNKKVYLKFYDEINVSLVMLDDI